MQIFLPYVPIISLLSWIVGDVQMASVKDCSSFCFRSNRPGKDKLDGLVNTFKTVGWLVTRRLSPLCRGAKSWMENWKSKRITRMTQEDMSLFGFLVLCINGFSEEKKHPINCIKPLYSSFKWLKSLKTWVRSVFWKYNWWVILSLGFSL